MQRNCLYCDSPIPDSVRGTFCDDDCESKYDKELEHSSKRRINEGELHDNLRMNCGYLNKLW